jgi:glycerol-1-phosphate dehydrogenase [NAD(P)+]
MMEKARTDCMDTYTDLTQYKPNAVAKLMDALVMAVLAMAECGNSRPASGSEHHMSHFLEMDFVSRGERVPLHGVKVAIGTLISIELYNYLKDNAVQFNNCEKVYELVDKLPKVEQVKNMLVGMGCPVRFSEIGVRENTFLEMIEKAHTVRDRYTVLTLINQLGIADKVKPILLEKYF